ncbi:MAG: Fe(2+)-trafficking protein [Phycisphaerales bacterium]|nr:Fe(2+)-trafficking protein [Phycisphaerales bacterium]
MDPEKRISQFQRLIADDPNNDMAYFSLANALMQSDRYDEAGDTFAKCAQINEAMTKAYQLAGDAYIKAGMVDQAKVVLTKGYIEATTRGDLLPKNAIVDLLKSINEPIPEVKDSKPKTDTQSVATGDFKCLKSGQMGTQIPRQPFRNAMGEWIHSNISNETFTEWIKLGTKIINELRLDLSRDDHDAVYEYAMRIFLGYSDEMYTEQMGEEPPAVDGQFRTVVEDMMAMGGHLESFQGNLHTKVEEKTE